MRHTSIDLKIAKNDISPNSGYQRVKLDTDGKLYKITDTGKKQSIVSPYDYPVISYAYNSPNSLTLAENDRYIVLPTGQDDWLNQDNNIAIYKNNNWIFIEPEEGQLVYNKDTKSFLVFNGTQWDILSGSGDVNTDNVTTATFEGYQPFSNSENNIHDLLDKYWMHGVPTGSDVGWRGAVVKDGVSQVSPNSVLIYGWNDSDPNNVVWDAGTYELYSTLDLDSYNLAIKDKDDNEYLFGNHTKVGIFYKYSITLPAAIYSFLYTKIHINKPYSIYLIDRYNSAQEEEIQIKNIRAIIDGNNISIDGSFSDATDAHKELVTRNFVESRLSSADEVTLTSYKDNIVLSCEAHTEAGFSHAEVNALKEAYLSKYPNSKLKTLTEKYPNKFLIL